MGFIKSYNYELNKLYFIYSDDYINSTIYNNEKIQSKIYSNLAIHNDKNLLKLIGASLDGYIRIWDFLSGLLLDKINIRSELFGFCLWNDDYLFVGLLAFLFL